MNTGWVRLIILFKSKDHFIRYVAVTSGVGYSFDSLTWLVFLRSWRLRVFFVGDSGSILCPEQKMKRRAACCCGGEMSVPSALVGSNMCMTNLVPIEIYV